MRQSHLGGLLKHRRLGPPPEFPTQKILRGAISFTFLAVCRGAASADPEPLLRMSQEQSGRRWEEGEVTEQLRG